MLSFEKYFSVQVFFLIFRETLETAIIVSVLLAFLRRGLAGAGPATGIQNSTTRGFQSIPNDEPPTVGTALRTHQEGFASKKMYKRLVTQVWVGAVLGLVVCMIIGAFFIFLFYTLGTNLWNVTEKLWEATFSILASVIITIMGLAMLRINKMKDKWRLKMAKIIIETHEGKGGWGLKHISRKYAMAILPLVTTLREGLEAVVFLGGMGASQPASSFPLAVICAIALGILVGYFLYKYGNSVSLQYFMIGSTCFLYLVAAGLFSRGVWFIELQQFINKVGQDVSEQGSGPGSYDISRSVWHVNCCNSQTDGPWMLFNALLGWQNSATYGSVISYNLYWWVVICGIAISRYRETHHGMLPIIPESWQPKKKYVVHNEEEAQALMNRATLLYTGESAGTGANNPRPSHESLNSNTPLVR